MIEDLKNIIKNNFKNLEIYIVSNDSNFEWLIYLKSPIKGRRIGDIIMRKSKYF